MDLLGQYEVELKKQLEAAEAELELLKRNVSPDSGAIADVTETADELTDLLRKTASYRGTTKCR